MQNPLKICVGVFIYVKFNLVQKLSPYTILALGTFCRVKQKRLRCVIQSGWAVALSCTISRAAPTNQHPPALPLTCPRCTMDPISLQQNQSMPIPIPFPPMHSLDTAVQSQVCQRHTLTQTQFIIPAPPFYILYRGKIVISFTSLLHSILRSCSCQQQLT